MRYFDAHCHIQFEDYGHDQADLIERMKADGVAGIVVGVDEPSSRKAVALAERGCDLVRMPNDDHEGGMDRCAAQRIRIGRDLQLVNINTLEPNRVISGIFQNPTNIGAKAVQMLVEKINSNEYGIPAVRHTTLTPGQWVKGTTLRPVRRSEMVRPS